MVTAVLLLIATQRGEISVAPQVARLEVLLPAIGQQAGQKFYASENVKHDVVALASPKRPVKEIMAVLAKTANATWKEGPTGWTLERSAAQARADENIDVASRVAWMKRTLDKTPLRDSFDAAQAAGLANYRYEFKAKKEREESDYAQLDGMNARSPLGRLTRRLVESIGIEYLARLPQKARTVLSTKPTNMQIRLDVKKVQPAIDAYIEEQSLYASAVKDRGNPAGGENMNYVSGFDHTRPPPDKWERILVSIDTTSAFQTFLLVMFVGAENEVLSTANCYLNQSTGNDAAQPADFSPTVDLPSLVYEVSEMLSVDGATMSDALRTPFRQPLEREPLAWVHRESIQAWSNWIGKPVAALLPDFALMTYAIKAPFTVGTYRQRLTTFCSFDESEASLVIRPRMPHQARETRTNRAALQQLIDSTLRHGTMTIDSVIDFAPHERDGVDFLLSLALEQQLPTQGMELVRIVAAGPREQRAAFLAGHQLTYGRMNPNQRALAHKSYFDSAEANYVLSGPVSTKLAERTEQWPNGLPDDAVLESTYSDNRAVGVYGRRGQFGPADLVAPRVAMMQDPTTLEFQYGQQQMLRLSLRVGRESRSGEIQSKVLADGGKRVSRANLPDDLRIPLEAAIAKWRNRVPPP